MENDVNFFYQFGIHILWPLGLFGGYLVFFGGYLVFFGGYLVFFSVFVLKKSGNLGNPQEGLGEDWANFCLLGVYSLSAVFLTLQKESKILATFLPRFYYYY
jgi:hypothetical protein